HHRITNAFDLFTIIVVFTHTLYYDRRLVIDGHVISLFSHHVDRPIQHSFPTRRSSDLSTRAELVEALQGDQPKIVFVKGTIDGRSEEHTSELQSRENLVCRLLLEKKKTDSNFYKQIFNQIFKNVHSWFTNSCHCLQLLI